MRRNFPIVQIAQPEAGGVLSRAAGSTFMPNKRGNPNWGRPMQPASVLCTEFEMQAKHLQLTPDQYVASAACANGARTTKINTTSQNGCSKLGICP